MPAKTKSGLGSKPENRKSVEAFHMGDRVCIQPLEPLALDLHGLESEIRVRNPTRDSDVRHKHCNCSGKHPVQ